ncbi:glutamate ABC transporter substrate-binding protein [Cellulomonas fengjieae]|uniref:Glutamate ABC transporter substrate-binding protein n=1 Tax=Cellulomonas fengjieae TaxID=2819978 RepID=A0ABS3SDG1_9CELL|nr:glutamate ABC transporter substrate-binding protein [Cellulomonas fengjieae]MBO3083359.1 glutamate ABC transporter substrate-binding protein [Cellulomonas fengjieae]QVI65298.1 glutamate ABC transporter substrate-binding protein [Cellulomonas fengjieae]
MTTTIARTLGAAVAALALLAGCAGAPAAAPAAPQQRAASVTLPAAPVCDDANESTTSYAPVPGEAAPNVDAIRARGALRVGVSADTLLMGSRNPLTGQIEGFDVDMLRAVSAAIFGDPDRLQFRVITSAQRLEVLESHEVDLVARAFTVNCERWETIAFSAEYLTAGQKVLVTRDSDAGGIEDLAGERVCAPEGTTTLERLEETYPDVTAVSAPTHTGCLVLFQQGRVDAITGDDTILAGFAAQDPYAKVVGEAFSAEPYGIGVAADQVDLVRFVNGVLDQSKADGTWAASYDRWLGALGPAPVPPVSVYGR